LTIENVDEWLNKEIFTKVVQNDLKFDDFKILSISTIPATKPGDNYLSILLRTKVEIELSNGEMKKLSYVVKCFLSSVFDEDRQKLVRELEVFSKEKKMYAKFLPAFEKLYNDIGIDIKFGPKCFLVLSEPTDMIIMEDLNEYKMANRKLGLDENHVKIGLEWMAKFHAASMVHWEKFGDYDEEFKSGIYKDSISEQYESYFNLYFDHYLDALRSLPNGETYVSKVECWRGQVFQKMSESIKFDENSVNVLVHGDAWLNNLLFLYDDNEEEVKDVRFVDFQLGFYGSFAQDIYHFMITSWEMKIKVHKFNELIEFYGEKLKENLMSLKFIGKVPTLDELKNELDKRIDFGKY
jgi:hypothetical protein